VLEPFLTGAAGEMRRFLLANRTRVARSPSFLFQAAANAGEAAQTTAVHYWIHSCWIERITMVQEELL